MRWKIVRADDNDQAALTSSELVGISVLLTQRCGEPRDESNVYWRARQKMQPEVELAIEDDN